MRYTLFTLVILSAFQTAEAKDKRISEKYSKREDMATDVPYYLANSRFVVKDTINGKKVNSNGAPVVIFDGDHSVVVGTVPNGTQVELKEFTSHRGMIFWPVSYTDEQGVKKQAWINGQFIERQ